MRFNTIPSSSVGRGAALVQVVIESGSGNWTPPRNMVGSFVDVTLVGGGGGGGNHTLTDYGGGGGGGGETIFRSPVFVDGLIAYLIGAGGIGRVFGTINEGTAGGSSTFGLLTAEGGDAGGHSLSAPEGAGGGDTGGAPASSEGDPGNDGAENVATSQIIRRVGGASGGAYTNDTNDGGKGGDTIFAVGGASTGTDDMGGGGASSGAGGAHGPNTTDVTPLVGGGGAGGQATGSLDAQDGARGRLIIEYWTTG